jgi:hypothetical protein
MDTCLGDIGPPPPLPLAILLNIVTCGASVAMWMLAAWCDRGGRPGDALSSIPSPPVYGLAFGGLVQYLSIMAFALSLPVLLVFYLANPGSELACQASVLNNVGPVPWGLITAIFPVVLLAFDLPRSCCTRHALARRMARAVAQSPGAFEQCGLDEAPSRRRSASVLILPAGGARGLFVAPLVRELRSALLSEAGEGNDGSGGLVVRTTIADAWATAWQPQGSARILHHLACEGEDTDVEAAHADFFGPAAVPAAPASLDAILIPYSKHLTAVNSGDKTRERTTRLLHFLGACAGALRPGGILAAGVLRGAEARLWSASLDAVGLEDVTLHRGNIWLSPSPVAILTARVPADRPISPRAQPPSSKSHLPDVLTPLPSPPPLQAPRPWFPAGDQWRARDAAVAATWTPVALLTWAASAYLPRLLVPTFVTWGSSVGTLALSSALFGPSCAYYTADELTKFAAGKASPGAYKHRHHQHGKPRGSAVGMDSAEGGHEALLGDGGPPGDELPASGSPQPSAAEVWKRWLTFELPIFAANIGGFQVVFWLPAFATDAAVITSDGKTAAGEADIAAEGLSYGLLAALILAGWVWYVRRARADEAEALEAVREAGEAATAAAADRADP